MPDHDLSVLEDEGYTVRQACDGAEVLRDADMDVIAAVLTRSGQAPPVGRAHHHPPQAPLSS
jgi:hypothetical protein